MHLELMKELLPELLKLIVGAICKVLPTLHDFGLFLEQGLTLLIR